MLYAFLNITKPAGYIFNFFFLTRSLFYALSIANIILYTENSSLLLNTLFQIIMSTGLLMYVLYCRPFIQMRDNIIEIMNECTILLLFVISLSTVIVDEELLSGE